MLERDSPTPLYEQVEALIKKNILNKTWPKGKKIPTETELMKKFGVSRGTLKRAISNLQKNGYLVQRQGLGTFVQADIEIPLEIGLYSFAYNFQAHHIDYSNKILSAKIPKKTSKDIADKLGITITDKYLCLRRLREVEGENIMLIENNINIANAPHIETADFSKESLFSIIERYSKETVEYSETKYSAVGANSEVSSYFNIKKGAPILYQEQLVHLSNNSIIEFARVWIKSNHFTLKTILHRK